VLTFHCSVAKVQLILYNTSMQCAHAAAAALSTTNTFGYSHTGFNVSRQSVLKSACSKLKKIQAKKVKA